jgi:hypothetical protein
MKRGMFSIAWAYGLAFVSAFSYCLLIYTPFGRTLFAGWLFGLHILAAMAGVVPCLLALWRRRIGVLPALVICVYILLFQLTALVPSPQAFLHPGR